MKKTMALLLALVMCLSLCACGGGEPSGTKPDQTEPSEEANQTESTEEENKLNLCQEWKSIATGEVISFDEEAFHINGDSYPYRYDEAASSIIVNVGVEVSLAVTLVDGIYRIDVEGEEYAPASAYEQLHAEYAKTMMVIPSFEGEPALNKTLVREHIDRVELTVDNWSDYIKEYSYEVEVIEKDAFGEIINTEKVTVYRLGYGTERYYCLNATIELKHKETGEIVLFGEMLASNLVEDIEAISLTPFNLDEYECTRIKGYMYFVDYPEEVFAEVVNVYDRDHADRANARITVTSEWMEGSWSLDTDAMVIESTSDNWMDYFE